MSERNVLSWSQYGNSFAALHEIADIEKGTPNDMINGLIFIIRKDIGTISTDILAEFKEIPKPAKFEHYPPIKASSRFNQEIRIGLFVGMKANEISVNTFHIFNTMAALKMQTAILKFPTFFPEQNVAKSLIYSIKTFLINASALLKVNKIYIFFETNEIEKFWVRYLLILFPVSQNTIFPLQPISSTPTPAPAPAQKPTPSPAPVQKPASSPAQIPTPVKTPHSSPGGDLSVLVAGAGENGKTTLIHHLMCLFSKGFTESEREKYIPTIVGNMIESLQILLSSMNSKGIFVDDENVGYADEITEMDPFSVDIDDELLEYSQSLWSDENIQNEFKQSGNLVIPDNIDYFFNKIEAVFDSHFVPSDEDILRTRVRTVGIKEQNIECNGAKVALIDIGGQQSERTKYEKIKSGIDGIIFVISLIDYDRQMFEDLSKNRREDQLQLFEWFLEKYQENSQPIALVCNKLDLFAKKINDGNSFIKVFPEYLGSTSNVNECADFYLQQFHAIAAKYNTKTMDFRLSALDQKQVTDTMGEISSFIARNKPVIGS